jgi:hypothetical protein
VKGLFFFQIKVLQHAIVSCWLPKEIHICVCGYT